MDAETKAIEKKWQKKWEDAKINETNPDNKKPKYFLNIPYPYVNAYPHLGHLYSYTKGDVTTRYKRMNGFNTLWAQGWHATGSPIVNAAKRVAEREEKQIKIMKQMGFTEEQIKKFEKPEYWIEFFQPKFSQTFKDLGFLIDWRREFYTTSLNPHYDKFIQWQFNKLKEKGYIIKGKFPVVWCPKESCPVSDHSRLEGEGETPQEWTILKFKLQTDEKTTYLVAATLRPETIYGQTNLWIKPDTTYKKIVVNKTEEWIIGESAVEKIKQQDNEVQEIGDIESNTLIGQKVIACGIKREIPILPATFINMQKGTGIVTCVPAHAPSDYVALKKIQQDTQTQQKYGLKKEDIEKIESIKIINISGYKENPAKEEWEKITKQNQGKLTEEEIEEEAKKNLYKAEHYKGTMNDKCEEYAGLKVEEAKEKIKTKLKEKKESATIYELTGQVICRCTTEALVKIVDDQWFIDYNNPEWKQKTHKALKQMKLYPEKSRNQFEYVIDWLREWACTREEGLGTRLPWDKKWLIESLSDSTIYMAYYTIAHLIKTIDAEQLNDEVFDYIFLGKGNKPEIEKIEEMKQNFEYYYPFDLRSSAKDLIQNHMTFAIFNHTAIWDETKWPKAYALNGYVTVNGEKMSKSKGNFLMIKDIIEEYGSDIARITILSGGEGIDDANWEEDFAKTIGNKLETIKTYAQENYKKIETKTEKLEIDLWLETQIELTIKEVSNQIEETLFRTAIQKSLFGLQNDLKWYNRRTNGKTNQETINKFIETQLKLLTPIIPHTCEEIWEKIGKTEMISTSEWPKQLKIEENKYDYGEKIIETIITDINSLKKITGIEQPTTIKLIVADEWKYKLYQLVSEEMKQTRDFKTIIGKAMQDETIKQNGKQATPIITKLIKNPKGLENTQNQTYEQKLLMQAKEFLETENQCKVEIELETKSTQEKAIKALPTKPVIIME